MHAYVHLYTYIHEHLFLPRRHALVINLFSATSLQILYEFSTKVQPSVLLVHTECNLDNGMPKPYPLLGMDTVESSYMNARLRNHPWADPGSAVQCNAMQFNAMPCHAMPCDAMR